MKIRPFSTLGLRISLRIETRLNAFLRGHRRAPKRIDGTVKGWVSSRPHPYPGIGHQLAAVIAGYLWAKDLGLTFIPQPLVGDEAGLFRFQAEANDVASRRTKRLPSVNDERDADSLAILRAACLRRARMPGQRVLYQFALDQYRWDHTPAAGFVRRAVESGAYGNQLALAETTPYVAIHIRRGDVNQNDIGGATGISRWVPFEWYVDLIDLLVSMSSINGWPIHVIASGSASELAPLQERYPGRVVVRTGGTLEQDFITLAGAKVLFCAPSSFSFSAALASKGVALAAYPWWHEVPDDGRWIRLGDDFSNLKSRIEDALDWVRRDDV